MAMQSGAEHYLPADEQPVTRHPRRKDRAKWCKGKPGHEHVPVVTEDHSLWWMANQPCVETPPGTFSMGCRHHLVCATCGRELLSSWSEKFRGMCPELRPEGQRAD